MEKTKGKRQLQKMATREHIIETAMSVYLKQGFSVPTNSIAQKAGVAHGTIFVHFPTREDLLFQALERFSTNIGTKLHELSAYEYKIEVLLKAHLEIISENEAFYKHLIQELPNLSLEARSLFISLNSIASHHFSIALESGIEKGELKKLSLHMTYNTWLGLIHYYLQNSEFFSPNGESVIKRYQDDLLDSFLAMIKK